MHPPLYAITLTSMILSLSYCSLYQLQNYHEYETIDEVLQPNLLPLALASHQIEQSSSEGYGRSNNIISQANPAYVSTLEDESMKDNVAYQPTEPYLEVID